MKKKSNLPGTFKAGAPLQRLADVSDADDKRIASRLVAGEHGLLASRAGLTLCSIVDLSETGAKLHVSQGLIPAIGELVSLSFLASGDFAARVVWVGPQSIGLSFLSSLDDAADELGCEALGAEYTRRVLAMQHRLRRRRGTPGE